MSYTAEEIKAFNEKDLRINRAAMLKSLIESLPVEEIHETENVCELAEQYVNFIYGKACRKNILGKGEKEQPESGTQHKPVGWAAITPVPNETEIKILKLLWVEYKNQCPNGIEAEQLISRRKLCYSIMDRFGKYPTKKESISTVMEEIKLEHLYKETENED